METNNLRFMQGKKNAYAYLHCSDAMFVSRNETVCDTSEQGFDTLC